jgi:hypothetical protein
MDAFRQAARATDGYDATNRRGRDGLNQAPILAGGGEKWVFLENLTTNAVAQLWSNRNRLVVDWSSHLRPRQVPAIANAKRRHLCLRYKSPVAFPNSI